MAAVEGIIVANPDPGARSVQVLDDLRALCPWTTRSFIDPIVTAMIASRWHRIFCRILQES